MASAALAIFIALIGVAMGALPKYRRLNDIQKAFLLGRSTARVRVPRPANIDESTLQFRATAKPVSHW
jgi:hypothetical protein